MQPVSLTTAFDIVVGWTKDVTMDRSYDPGQVLNGLNPAVLSAGDTYVIRHVGKQHRTTRPGEIEENLRRRTAQDHSQYRELH
jgi:hypothetical protein